MASKLDPTAVFGELVQSYLKLPLFQKIIFPVLIIASIMGIVWVSKWANQPDYTLLYSDLSPTDSAAVVERLKAQKVKYQIRGDGTSIAISPAELVHELRLSLAAEGIPKGGTVGLEIFDVNSFGSTTFQEKVKFLRAIQGELERTISSMESVQTVRVAITQPERTIFSKERSEATASVLLMLRGNGELETKQIKGIMNLVAASVEGLKPENVTVVDVYGNLLSPDSDEEEGLLAEATRLQYKKQLERSYEQSIENMLTRIVGPKKVVAHVTADLDFSLNEREEEIYDPGSQVIISERSIEEGVGSSQRSGVPGVVSNLNNDPNLVAPKSATSDGSARTESVKNYEVSKAIHKVSDPRGKLIKLSVAVLVDGKYTVPEGLPEGVIPTPIFSQLEQETMDQIEDLVKNAVGFDYVRGDTLSVENIPFFAPERTLLEQMEGKATEDLIFNSIFKAGPLLFIALFFFMLVRPLVKFLVTPTDAEVDLSRLLPTGISELEEELAAERSRPEIPQAESVIDIDQLNELIAENAKSVKENPEQAALLIRYWLNDGRM